MADLDSPARALRVDAHVAAMLVDSDGGTLSAVVSNISSSGCRLQTDGSLELGEEIVIRPAREAAFCARICWIDGRDAGAEFLDKLPPQLAF